MSHFHPGVQLLLLSGLAIFWLIPLSSWLMLSGQRDRNATMWFSGTGFYALVLASVDRVQVSLDLDTSTPFLFTAGDEIHPDEPAGQRH